jgi:hypothetical protein
MSSEKIANLPNRVRATRAGSRGRWLFWISLNGIRPGDAELILSLCLADIPANS